jgi:hypothetical protein
MATANRKELSLAYINPLLNSISELRHRLEAGESLRASLPLCLNTNDSGWNNLARRWLIAHEHGTPTEKIVSEIKSPFRRIFLEMLAAGLNGAPIFQNLLELEKEVHAACELEIEENLRRLPFLSLLPVLFFMFPAFLLLLLGPVLLHLLQELSQ